jgi:hypothetical protein
VRRLLPLPAVLALVLAAPAAGGTIRGTAHADDIVGTAARDTIRASAGDDLIQVAWGAVDRVTCGPGRDVVAADLADVVAPDCEVVSRRLSVDLSTNPDSQHETAVEPDSFAWGSTVVAAFQLGRYDERGAASNIGTAVSTDAGRTWRRSVLPGVTVESQPRGTQLRASDPTVAYDAVHGVWLVGTLTLAGAAPASSVLVARSQDGLHWSLPVTVASGPILDKDWLVCDDGAQSPHRGRCYAAYTDDALNRTVVQSSDDGGLTWSDPVEASSTLVGTQPVVQPDGTLVVVAGDYNGAQGLTGSMVSLVSTDGGATFTRSTVATFRAARTDPMRAISLPSVDVDPSGKLYAVWDDCRFRTACTGNDLVLSTSTDGATWTAPARIPAPAGTASVSAFNPGLAADPTQPAHLGLVYAYFTPGSCERAACALSTGFVSSTDGGTTWSVPQLLSPQPVRTTWLAHSEGGRMVGDYFSTSYAGGRWVPVFALAEAPVATRFREAIFAASLPALPAPRPRR